LRALLDLHSRNRCLLECKPEYLLSSRSLLAIYRGNLARVTVLLDSDAIAKVVAAFAENERIEALLTTRAQPKGGASYKIVPGEMDYQELRLMYENAERTIMAAVASLDSIVRDAAPSINVERRTVALSQTS
jgi:hypothetical protein